MKARWKAFCIWMMWRHQKRGLWNYEVAAKWRERAEWF